MRIGDLLYITGVCLVLALCKVVENMRTVYRSAITGKFVSREYAMEHPNTTIRQKVQDPVTKSDDLMERMAARATDAMTEQIKHSRT